jgi:hypothetical protein
MPRKRKTDDGYIGDETESEETGARPALNSEARAEIIREAHETISEYERQIDGLKAEIKPSSIPGSSPS